MKKTAKNDITGAWIVSKPNTEMFEKNFDLIFGKKKRSDDISPHTHEYELNKSTGELQVCDNCECNVKGCE